jgi:outer membrane protein assembly factor BamB
MTPSNPSGVSSYRFDEIAIWRTKLPNAEHAVLPPSNNRPNPLVTETMVYASVFSPGAVCALARKTGKLVWRRAIPKFGGSAVHLSQGKLFAKTANTLYALEPTTGKVIWSFCPYGDSGESIYSEPTLYRNSLFIGDRRGYLHCLNSQTGKTRWKLLTNKAKNCDLNSTPVVVNGLVIVGTNAKMAAAYNARTGKRVWTCRLNGPSGFGPLLCRGLLAVITDSVYLLKPKNGAVVRRFSWKGDGVSHAASTLKDIIAILREASRPAGDVRLVGLNESGIRFTETCQTFVAFLRHAAETNLIYVSHLQGIDVRRSESGVIACKIERETSSAGNGPVDVKRNTIYVLTSDGYVYALRHPSI